MVSDSLGLSSACVHLKHIKALFITESYPVGCSWGSFSSANVPNGEFDGTVKPKVSVV